MKQSQLSERESVANTQLPPLIDAFGVAKATGLSVATVRRWRYLKAGPKFIKIGAAVRYNPEDISAWIAPRPTAGGPQEAL
jgi:predicted DNA-binding transcriptional regulator AlpA